MTTTKEPTRQDINDACAHFERLVRLGALTAEDAVHVYVRVYAANLDGERAERIATLEQQISALQARLQSAVQEERGACAAIAQDIFVGNTEIPRKDAAAWIACAEHIYGEIRGRDGSGG